MWMAIENIYAEMGINLDDVKEVKIQRCRYVCWGLIFASDLHACHQG